MRTNGYIRMPYYEIDIREEPCLTCLIKSYVEGDKEVFEEVNDGEET